MTDQHPLSGKTALVTGGAGGIGLATVRALSALGAEVTFTARSEASRSAALAQLEGTGARGVICDITRREQLTAALAPGFDILINNAAVIHPIGLIADITTEAYAEAITTNLVAQFDAIRQAIPPMLARDGGTIVNISSGAAHRPALGWAAYCSSKAGLAMLTRQVHLEYGEQGIRCFGIAPGVVDTGMQEKIRASGINPVSKLPRSALSPTDQPGRAIAWLCTPAAEPYVGQELDIRDPELRAAIGLPALG